MVSETSSAPFHDSRSFRQLSVYVINNNHHHGVVGEVVEKEKRTPKANQYYRNSEFLLGKDKLPPESNRKSKSTGGKRHGGADFDGLIIDKKIFGKCSSLLQKIMNHKHDWVFNHPVDVKRLGLHDYVDIIIIQPFQQKEEWEQRKDGKREGFNDTLMVMGGKGEGFLKKWGNGEERASFSF